MHILLYTHLNLSHKCFLYFNSNTIQISLVVEKIHWFHYGYASAHTPAGRLENDLVKNFRQMSCAVINGSLHLYYQTTLMQQ